MLRRTFLARVLPGIALTACGSKSTSDAKPPPTAPLTLDELITQQLEAAKLPGLSVAIIKGGKVALVRHYGMADLAATRAVGDDTSFFLASLSKTTTGTAAMMLVDEGKLALDEDVNTYLPFRVRNPKFDGAKITLRHLMSHTSGIGETPGRLLSLSKPGDPTMSLQELLEPYLVPGGATYTESESWGANAPGAKFVYSNFGAAVVGLVIERATSLPFATAMRERVFAKLGFSGTSFLLADLDPAKIATPYTFVVGQGQKPEPQSSVPFLPATTVRAPAKELARFLTCIARGGEIDGTRLLSAAATTEMTKVQVTANDEGNDIAAQGLLWEHRTINGAACVGHGGSYFGTSTRMHFRISDGLGVITLANGDVHLRISLSRREELAAYQAIEQRLFEEGGRLAP